MVREFSESFFSDLVITHHYRHTAITTFTDGLHQWYLTKEWKIILIRQSLPSSFSKNIIFVIRQFCSRELTHIFYESKYGYIHLRLSKHRNPFFSICKRNILRSSNDDRTRNRNDLHQRQMDISCSRWHINNEVIELIPKHFRHKLPDRTTRHRASPYNCT